MEEIIMCSYCGMKIDDYSYVTVTHKNKSKHFHSMHSGGAKDTVKITCLEEHEMREVK